MRVFVAFAVDKGGFEVVGLFKLVSDAKEACHQHMGRTSAWKIVLKDEDGDKYSMDNVDCWWTLDYGTTYYIRNYEVQE